jgi:hypothetical protein
MHRIWPGTALGAIVGAIVVASCGTSSGRHPSAPSTSDVQHATLARVQVIVDNSCSDCHDASNAHIDLTTKLGPRDPRLARIRDAVGSFKMPPPLSREVTQENDIALRFPMAPDVRHALQADLDLLVAPPPRTNKVVVLSADQRLAVMRAVASTWLPQTTIDRIVSPLLSNRLYVVAEFFPAAQMVEIKLRVIARGLCRAAVKQPGLGSDASGPAAIVERLLWDIYGERPTEGELRQALEMLKAYEPEVALPDTPLIGLCTTHLSGPKLSSLRVVDSRAMHE